MADPVLTESLLLTFSAQDLQALLTNGKITSLSLVKACLAQIKKYDRQGPHCRAMICTAPETRLFKVAAQLDRERADGEVRGPLHGIPVIVKDSISTGPELGMCTTLGSYAFETAMHKTGASVIDKLIDKGLIILGKTNLTELGNFKGDNLTSGWSPLGGQVQSGYIQGGVKRREQRAGNTSPGGSSSGSAVGVSVGYSPLAIGTEADGSVVTPASRSALYGMKPTNGTVDMSGIWRVSNTFDVVGCMAKTVHDMATLVEHTLDKGPRSRLPADGYASSLDQSWSGMRIGMVDPHHWVLPPHVCTYDAELHDATKSAIFERLENMRAAGADLVYPVDLSHIRTSGDTFKIIVQYEARQIIEHYFTELQDCQFQKVEDLVQWNIDHAELELPEDYPNQAFLQLVADARISDAKYKRALETLREMRRRLEATFDEHSIDVIMGPMDSSMPAVAALAGAPDATVPIGILPKIGRPFGLCLIARPAGEAALFKAMSAYEATFPDRSLPPLVIHSE